MPILAQFSLRVIRPLLAVTSGLQLEQLRVAAAQCDQLPMRALQMCIRDSAYMRDAQVLILDEPTASLDARAEYEVFLRFADLTRGRMAVLISHRFSTVRMADRILVLADGELVEQGTHRQLVALGGRYAELFELQAAGYR